MQRLFEIEEDKCADWTLDSSKEDNFGLTGVCIVSTVALDFVYSPFTASGAGMSVHPTPQNDLDKEHSGILT